MSPLEMARAGWDGVPGHVDAPVGSLRTGGGICVFSEDVYPSLKGVLDAPGPSTQGKDVRRGGQGGTNVGTSEGGDLHE